MKAGRREGRRGGRRGEGAGEEEGEEGGEGGGRREASEFAVSSEVTGRSESCRGQDLENCLLRLVPGAPGGTLFPQRGAELAPLLSRLRRSSWFNGRKIVIL